MSSVLVIYVMYILDDNQPAPNEKKHHVSGLAGMNMQNRRKYKCSGKRLGRRDKNMIIYNTGKWPGIWMAFDILDEILIYGLQNGISLRIVWDVQFKIMQGISASKSCIFL